jgi:hypothetical protein
VDVQERRFVAQCVQQLSSSNLSALLDLLLLHHPKDVVERKGGDSYHIDFGTLPDESFALARKFIKDALRDDDDSDFVRQDSLSSLPPQRKSPLMMLPPLPSPTSASDITQAIQTSNSTSSYSQNPQNEREAKINSLDSTPVLPYPNGSKENTSASLDSITVSPEKRSSRIKRQSESVSSSPEPSTSAEDTASPAPHDAKKADSRYYNGERIWRHANMDKTFTFHGMNVLLLGQHVETTKPWVCTLCHKAFVSKDKVVNHVQQHSGEKLHECPICHGRFSSKHYLKEHEKRVHQYDCHQCGKVFLTFDELHEHALQAHPKLEAKPCNCKKGCANSRCSCFKNGLNCTASCLCQNCNNQG